MQLGNITDTLLRIASSVIKLPKEEFYIDEQFSDLGFDSVTVGQLVKNINEELNISLSPTIVFSYPNIRELNGYILKHFKEIVTAQPIQEKLLKQERGIFNHIPESKRGKKRTKRISGSTTESGTESVAIIGMSGQYGKAENLDVLWDLISRGESLIEEVPENRWSIAEFFSPDKTDEKKTYCKWGSFLRDIDKFDPIFFKISGSEAELMDPQHRIFLQHCWKALEDAAIAPGSLNNSKCGVFVGASEGDYMQNIDNSWGSTSSILAARISYFLNLKGPAIALNTACSSSLVALEIACKALLSKDVDLALSGGISLYITPDFYLSASKSNMLSEDGQCFTFDNRANGFVPGEGAGVVVLKRLKDAQRDGDRIYGVIKGIGINQDGTTNGITAPSVISQEQLEQEVYEKYKIDPATITYVEAHGTGTRLGDPIEFEALNNAFRSKTNRSGFCALGSIKMNIGHTLLAAGIAGLHKVLLCMKYRSLTPAVTFKNNNPLIALDNSPFYINTGLKEWTHDPSVPRRAAISSFGISGTNAHVIVEEYISDKTHFYSQDNPSVIVLSAKNEERLKEYANNLLFYLESNPEVSLYDIAYTLQTGRDAMDVRWAAVVKTLEELKTELRQYTNNNTGSFIIGNIKKNKPSSLNSSSENIASKEIKTAHQWVQGEGIDWNELYIGNNKPSKISLPTYPFAKESYWIDGIRIKTVQSSSELIHPLLHTNVSSLREQKFKSVFQGTESVLTDHKVNGDKVFPGVAYLELARVAGSISSESIVTGFSDVSWISPIIVQNPKEINISVFQEEDGLCFEVFSGSGREEQVHCQGKLLFEKMDFPAAYNVQEIKTQFEYTRGKLFCYDLFKSLGIDYGPDFQGIEEIWYNSGAALSRINLRNHQGFELPPGMMDCAFQTCLGTMLGHDNIELSVPYSINQLILYKKLPDEVWCYSQKRERREDQNKIHHFDIDLINAEGEILLSIRDFVTFSVNQGLVKTEEFENSHNHYYENLWAPSHQILKTQKIVDRQLILVAGGSAQLCDNLRASLEVEVVNIEDSSDEEYFLSVFANVKEKTVDNKPISITLVCENNEYGEFGFVSALFKTVTQENPRINGKVIGVDNLSVHTIDRLVSILEEEQGCGDAEVRYIQGIREVKELHPVKVADIKNIEVKENGVYLITGGIGGLGKIFTSYISSKKGVRLILTGRSELDDDKKYYLKSIPDAEYQVCNVSEKEEVITLIQNIKEKYGKLNGVIHAAGIVRDNFVLYKTNEEISSVLSAKISGTKNLDDATKNEALDFMVLFSSMAGVLGNIGQADYAAANAWLDEFSQYRNELRNKGQRQGRTISIDWSFWKDGGMQVEEEFQKRFERELGILPLPTNYGIEAFESLLNSNASHAIVAYGKRNQIEERLLKYGKAKEIKTVKPQASGTATSGNQLKKAGIEYLARLMSGIIKIPASRIDEDDQFDKYGLDSMLIAKLTNQLDTVFGRLPRTLFFEYQTLSELVNYFLEDHRERLEEVVSLKESKIEEKALDISLVTTSDISRDVPFRRKKKLPDSIHESNSEEDRAVAIIGISGKYPGADNLESFWENLKNGTDCITEVPKDRWDVDRIFDANPNAKGKVYSKWGGFISDVDKFDALFFNISPSEAELLDPQERLFLQTVWETIEDAGYTRSLLQDTGSSKGNIGVYVGVMHEEYQLYGAEETLKGNPLSLSGSPSSIANRVSYFFNFHGPSMAIDSMCSSSLTAIHLACESLQNGSIEMAIAGGVNVSVHQNKYLLLSERRFISANGRCESFGVGGDGYIPAEGVGAVLLKPLKKAKADGDRIYGIIKSSALNHGGKTNGYTVPNPISQSQVIKDAMKKARVTAEDYSYIEAHGTGTSLGDPIEIVGLTKAFESDKKQFCAIGSVKSNIGHCESAAGVSALTKVLLQMKHKQLVPSLHSKILNPNIDFSKTPFRVQQTLESWSSQKNKPRLAGISSFGAGGSNAHLIIEEYPEASGSLSCDGPVLILLSAKNEDRLKAHAQNLRNFFRKNRDLNLADVAYTLQTGREAMEERLAFLCNDKDELLNLLSEYLEQGLTSIKDVLFSGNVIRDKESLEMFITGIEGEEYLKKITGQKNLQKLGQLWVKGSTIDWKLLYPDSKPRKISLPSYPFEKSRFWFPETGNKILSPQNLKQEADDILISSDPDDADHFIVKFSGTEMYLRDHVINNERILPGVAYLELVYKAVQLRYELDMMYRFRLTDITWLEPFSIERGNSIVSIRLDSTNGGLQFRILDGDDEDRVFCKGEVEFVPDETELYSIDEIKQRCSLKKYTGTSCYQVLSKLNLEYGTSHRLIQEVCTGENELIASLKVSEQYLKSVTDFAFHPGLLDAALQSNVALAMDLDSNEIQGAIPFKLGLVTLHKTCKSEMLAWCRISDKGVSNELLIDIDLLDTNGQLCISFKGLRSTLFKKKTNAATSEKYSTLLCSSDWKIKNILNGHRIKFDKITTVIIAGRNQVFSEAREVIHWESINGNHGASYSDYALKIFELVKSRLQQLGRSKHLFQLVLQAQGPLLEGLSGLLKTAKLENPSFYGQLIVLDEYTPLNEELLFENEFNCEDVYVRYTKGSRYVQEWKELDTIKVSPDKPWKDFGTYVITGGLGGLGLIFANEIAGLVESPRLIISGRSELTPPKEKLLEDLRSEGALVEYHQVDVTNEIMVGDFIRKTISRHNGINGIIHSAGIIKDNFILRKNAEDIRQVLSPKVNGVLNLDEAIGNSQIDFIFLVSSIAGAFGNPGQSDYSMANAFMDLFANYRNKQVLEKRKTGRTLSINWPLWANGGMRVDSKTEEMLLLMAGMVPLHTASGIQAFYEAWNSGLDQVIVLQGIETRLKKLLRIQDNIISEEIASDEYEWSELLDQVAGGAISETDFLMLLR